MIRVHRVQGDRLETLHSLKDYDPVQDVGWIDLLMPTAEEDRAVEDFLKLSIPTKEDMEEIELSARLYEEADVNYMTIVATAQIALEDPLRTPVTFILHGKTLVTVRYHELMSFSQYEARARKKGGVLVPSSGGIMIDIVESVVNRIADSLEILGSDIDTISRDIFRSKKISVKRKTGLLQFTIRKVGEKGDFLSMLRESLASISRLSAHYNIRLDEGSGKALRAKVSVLGRDVASLNDHASFLSGKMNFLLDATLGMINLEQNQIIKIFSVAAVVFLPPTLIASVYGMNFHHMPELDFPFGYPLALAGMLISALIPLAYFKKKGWL